MSDIRAVVNPSAAVGVIRPDLHGHFMEHLGDCVEGGCWVGDDSAIANTGGIRNDVVEALREIGAPVIRWPGGCFADDYHWRDGVGPRSRRPRTVNMHWGDVIEDNAFGTHEFMAFCRAVGAAPYFCGNVGSGTPQELRDWVEYCNYPSDSTLARERTANGAADPFAIRYWGVGNENWGCGGHFTPEDYGSEFRRFATYLRDWGADPLYLIACGPNGNDLDWTRRLFEKLFSDYGRGPRFHGYSAHYYCGTAGTATEYTDMQWYELLWKATRMESLIVEQRELMDTFDPERKIGLIVDEWGTWHPPTPGLNPKFLWQQNTVRDALVAALTLDIFNRHADKVVMTNIAQTINVLQALLLTDGDRMVKTPTYHVYDLYQPHKGATAVRCQIDADMLTVGSAELPAVHGSASVVGDTLTVTLVNVHARDDRWVRLAIKGANCRSASERSLDYAYDKIDAFNDFGKPPRVYLSDEADEKISSNGGRILLGPATVKRLTIQLG